MSFLLAMLYPKKQPKYHQQMHDLLSQILYAIQFDQNKALLSMTVFLKAHTENTTKLFQELQHPTGTYPRPDGLNRLLLILHLMLLNPQLKEQVSVHMTDIQICWLNNNEVCSGERLEAEASFSASYAPKTRHEGVISLDTPKEVSKQQKKLDRSLKKIEMRRERMLEMKQKMIQKNISLQPKEFAQLYYSYLQRVAANFVLYQAIQMGLAPATQDGIKFLWLYKLQNLMSTGLKLIETIKTVLLPAQMLIYDDLVAMQNALVCEISRLVHDHRSLDRRDILSLYEIYCDTCKTELQLQSFMRESYAAHQRVVTPVNLMDVEPMQQFIKYATHNTKNSHQVYAVSPSGEPETGLFDTQENVSGVQPFFSKLHKRNISGFQLL